eukprot:TRINITY_DN18300_c0_g1_i1.p1 TRINITY_DN18300_c0_g1~~TRINITY_DN18300_c0_g1_i1.p1  ORF type:complete len:311 (-),score=59.10 TRINITY_DN18300_c0_g1_i1:101-1033(-)
MSESSKRMPGSGELKDHTQHHKEGVGLQHEMETQAITSSLADETSRSEGLPCLTPYRACCKLENRNALITGGDSGIGRSIAVFYAKEGANVAINYLPIEQKDAEETKRLVEQENRKCVLIPLDLQTEENCKKVIDTTVSALGGIDILVLNAAYQNVVQNIEDISCEQIEQTFKTNIYAPIFLSKHALKHMKQGSSILVSTSVVAYTGNKKLIDYACTKGALVTLVRSLALQLAPRGIRVNGVAPGPVWTPLQPISRSQEDLDEFGEKEPPLGRVAQPSEIAPSYVFLASCEGSQYTGQVLHPNSGYIVNP